MMADLLTVAFKEWREMLLMQGSTVKGGLSMLLLPIFIQGVFIPWQIGREFVTKPVFLLIWAWMPAFMMVNVVADSFAGERERHTLETLLASRISGRAILFGKLAAAVAYAWSITVFGMLLAVVTVNVKERGPFVMYSAGATAAVVVIALLMSGAIAALGIIVSLRAASVRQAGQILMLSVMGAFFGLTFGLRALPRDFRAAVARTFAAWSLADFVVACCAFLLVINALLILAAIKRFQRARLILD